MKTWKFLYINAENKDCWTTFNNAYKKLVLEHSSVGYVQASNQMNTGSQHLSAPKSPFCNCTAACDYLEKMNSTKN